MNNQQYYPYNPYGVPNAPFQQETRYLDLCFERNLWGYGLDNNQTVIPPVAVNNQLENNFDIFRSTVTNFPETPDLVKKCRLPLGLTLHPFRDMKNLNVLQTNIVRCRYCRAYINPYVSFSDSRHWRCNICYRNNDLPESFYYDPVRKEYSDPTNRPEILHNTVEYIASADYMLRPPQPSCFFFVLDTSKAAIRSGFIHIVAEQLQICLDQLPGGERAIIGFMCVDEAIHYFQFIQGERLPRHMTVYDAETDFTPVPDGLLVNLSSYKDPIRAFLQLLPVIFDEHSAPEQNSLGTALQLAFKIISNIGGRVTVFQNHLPNAGLFPLKNREKDERQTQNLGPATDFYKRLALESTGKQVAYDFFVVSDSYIDLATISDTAKISGGAVYYFEKFHSVRNPCQAKRFEKMLNRYLIRKVGFEAVLRIRCSQGVSLKQFYGNFFVRSTDLLVLPTVNPDAAIAAQLQVDEALTDLRMVVFQAALLYTSSRGDRRIRVHTMALPVTKDLGEVFKGFDIQASASLLAKMAVERAMLGGELTDCREGIINAAVDAFNSYNRSIGLRSGTLLAPISGSMKFFAAFVLGLLKHRAFYQGSTQVLSTDNQIATMILLRTAPIEVIMLEIYPALYPVHQMDGDEFPQRLSLTFERVNMDGIYVMDSGSCVYLFVNSYATPDRLIGLFNVSSFASIDEEAGIQELQNPMSIRFFGFLRALQKLRAGFYAPVVVIRADSPRRTEFTSRLIEDRTENSHSYVEFTNYIRNEVHR